MKNITSILPVLLLLLCSTGTGAQIVQSVPADGGGEYIIRRNDAATPCITAEQYAAIEREVAANTQALYLQGSLQKGASTSFDWPLRAAAGVTDCGFYGISAYVDEDAATPGIKDFNCGTTTYDGHKGTDIFIWPFPFYKMDHDQVEVIAAAAGTIITRVDGNFDRNCASNNLTPNYIVIQHADGSEALYLHMKSGSLTTKSVGQMVSSGEFLGRVGSSGSSTGPHLHFEVWGGTTVATRKDPFSGTCNYLNASSWWTAQKPYKNPEIIKASTHTAPPLIPACPTTETPNEDSCFDPGVSAVFAIYLRDETVGMTANMSIVNAAGTTVTSWVHNSSSNVSGSYWYWTKMLPSTPGRYTFKAVYNGITCAHNFKIDCNLPNGITGNSGSLPQITIAPVPANNEVYIQGNNALNGRYTFVVKNMVGQTLLTDSYEVTGRSLHKTISINDLPAGIYLLSIECGALKVTRKIVKQ